MSKKDKIFSGNAYKDRNERQWLLGHFRKGDLFDKNVEIKWSSIKAGQERGGWSKSKVAKTMSFLIKGKFAVISERSKHILKKEGDYVLWNKEIPHTWKALEDSVIISVRWPSKKGHNVELKNYGKKYK